MFQKLFRLPVLFLAFAAMTGICAADPAPVESGTEPLLWPNAYWNDPIQVVRDWTWTRTLIVTGSVGGVAALSLLHDDFRYWLRSEYHEYPNRWVDAMNFGASGYFIAIPIGIWGGAAASGHNYLANAAFTSIEAVLWSNLISKILKVSVGRVRPTYDHPEKSDRGDNFHPFTLRTDGSFPSGHTTFVFALVTPFVVYYPGVASFALLLFGVGAGLSRLAVDAHWSTDVLGGALLGSGVGYVLARAHLEKLKNSPVSLLPLISADREGMEVVLKF